MKVYEQNYIKEDPVLAVAIVIPRMQRAHSLPLKRKIVFIDTT
jgi:hypothetical protein